MDYDYYDESRTRLQVQSGPFAAAETADEKGSINFLEVGACCSVALLCLSFAWYSQGLLQFILLWLASALFVGPFAPSSATGGSSRVGFGELLPPEEEQEPSETEILSERSSRQRRKGLSLAAQGPKTDVDVGKESDNAVDQVCQNGMLESEETANVERGDEDEGSSCVEDEVFDFDNDTYHQKGVQPMPSTSLDQNAAKGDAEWTPTDLDLLKKLMVKYPRGMLKRWEVIAESFDGSHSVESIVKMSKILGEKKKSPNDSYTEFLAKRKGQVNAVTSPPSQRWDVDGPEIQKLDEAEVGERDLSHGEQDLSKVSNEPIQGQGKKKSEWAEAEDKALLSALKTFPKDTPMRWEKVALAVPSRTKQQCFRRYAQLKEGFRNKLEKN